MVYRFGCNFDVILLYIPLYFIYVETFPNATNPMKIIQSPSLPNLKVQRLNVLNKLSTIKGLCISSSSDGTEHSVEQPAPEHRCELERRTIDTKHISTVSSLVATNRDDDTGKSSISKESQRNNFGLYALKFHRNLATHANKFMNFKKDLDKRSKSSNNKTVAESTVCESPEFNASRANRSKHEYFKPCYEQTHYTGTGARYDREFDDGSNIEVWNHSNRFQRNRLKNDSQNISNEPIVRAPIRPRRIKPVAPKAKSIAGHDIDVKKNTHQQYLPYESTQPMDDFDSDQNVMNI